MKEVYILFHMYENNNGDEESKILGVFSEYRQAENAINEYLNLSGFKRYPNGFVIDAYKLNDLHWTEGFITIQ